VSRRLTELDAIRREWLAAVVGFFIILAAAAAGAVYITLKYVLPEGGWIDAVFSALRLMPFALLLGIWGGLLPMAILRRRHYALGIYRCYHCNRSLRSAGVACVCMPNEMRRVRRKPHGAMRHYRRRVKPVLLTYAVMTVPTLLLAHVARRPHIAWADLAFVHALCCLFTGIVIHLVEYTLEFLNRGRRFRLRAPVFVRVLAIWPLLVIVAGLISHAMGIDPLKH
jgi:hypothetical protein